MRWWVFWLISGAISCGINWVCCLVSWRCKTHKLTDVTYASTFVVLAVFAAAWRGGALNWVQVLVLIAMVLWAGRLGSYLLVRIFKVKSDPRFNKLDKKLRSWAAFWTVQALAVLALSAPFLYALSARPRTFTTHPAVVGGYLVALLGLTLETIADGQKYWFYGHQQRSKTTFVSHGLWRICRHPNYLGDMLFWWGLWLFTATAAWVQTPFRHSWYWLLLSLAPLLQTIMLVLVSGIPLLERNAWRKRGTDQLYQQYVNNTPVLVPLVGRRGLPRLLQRQLKIPAAHGQRSRPHRD